jgi:hypothetical protein
MYTDFDLVLRCFGEETIKKTFLWLQQEEVEVYGSDSIIERAYMMNYFSVILPDANLRHSLFGLHNIQLFQPYMYERFVETALLIDPRVRFYDKGTIKPVTKRLLQQKVNFDVNKPKLGGGLYPELVTWMKEGVLRDMVMNIDRPGFISKVDFEKKLADPDWFTWNMLTLDLLNKHVLQ